MSKRMFKYNSIVRGGKLGGGFLKAEFEKAESGKSKACRHFGGIFRTDSAKLCTCLSKLLHI